MEIVYSLYLIPIKIVIIAEKTKYTDKTQYFLYISCDFIKK